MKTGLGGILVGSQYESLDTIFSFLGAIVYKRCRLNETADIKRVFTRFVDIANLVYQHYLSPKWSEGDRSSFFYKRLDCLKFLRVTVLRFISRPKWEHKNSRHWITFVTQSETLVR